MLSCYDLQSSSRTRCSDINLRSFLFLKASWEEEEKEREVSKCFLLASTKNPITAFFFSFFLRGSPYFYPHQKSGLAEERTGRGGNSLRTFTDFKTSDQKSKGWMKSTSSLGGKEREGKRVRKRSSILARNICQRPKGPLFLGLTGPNSPHDQRRRCPYLQGTPHWSLVNQEHCSEATCMDLWVMQGWQHFALCFLPECYPG